MPRNRNQVQIKIRSDKRKARKDDCSNPQTTHSSNLADHFQQVSSMVDNLNQDKLFVRHFFHDANHSAALVLYTDEQIKDMVRFCCPAPTSHSTVIGIDKAFNLGPLHCTITTYKILALTRQNTGEHPICLGPLFLHGNSDTLTFPHFFDTSKFKLSDASSPPVFGSDEEVALRNACSSAFPNSGLLSCLCHLKCNTLNYLKDTVGLCDRDRKIIKMSSIFGTNGVTETRDDKTFRTKLIRNVLNSSIILKNTSLLN